MGPIVGPEKSIRNYRLLGFLTLKMGPIVGPEKSITNYHLFGFLSLED
jgi:hypothetical protein